MGKEFEEEVEQRALELKFIREMAEKYGVDENRIFALMVGEGDDDGGKKAEERNSD